MTRQMTTEQIDADDELLSSYLDQELNQDERTQLERRLVDEEGLRTRLAEMRRTWELLDELPETPLNQHFTRSTLEMVTLDLEQGGQSGSLLVGWKPAWIARISPRGAAVIVTLLAVLLGSLAGIVIRNRSLRTEAFQLAIAGALPLLQDFPDVGMLEELLDTPRWKDLLEIPSLRDRVLTSAPEDEKIQSIRQWSSRLDVHQKELLYHQKQGFDRLPPNERRSIEDRYRKLRSAPNYEELQSVGTAIYGVLQSLPMNKRAEIRSLPNDRRVKALREEACFKLATLHADKLTPDEKVHLDRWAHADLMNQLQESSLPSQIQEAKLENLLLWTLFAPYTTSSQVSIDAFADPETLMESFYSGLTTDTVQLFQGVAPKSQFFIIASWVLSKKPEAVKRPSDDELYERYKALTDDRRDRLDMQRPEEARRDMEARAGRGRRPGQDGAVGPGPGPGGPGPFGPGMTGPRGNGGVGPFGPGQKGPSDLDRPPEPFAGPPFDGPKRPPKVKPEQ